MAGSSWVARAGGCGACGLAVPCSDAAVAALAAGVHGRGVVVVVCGTWPDSGVLDGMEADELGAVAGSRWSVAKACSSFSPEPHEAQNFMYRATIVSKYVSCALKSDSRVSPLEGRPYASRGSTGGGRRRDHAPEGPRRGTGRALVAIFCVIDQEGGSYAHPRQCRGLYHGWWMRRVKSACWSEEDSVKYECLLHVLVLHVLHVLHVLQVEASHVVFTRADVSHRAARLFGESPTGPPSRSY